MDGKTVELEFIVRTVEIFAQHSVDSTYSLPSVHHADGIPVWLLIVGSSYILHEDVTISRTLRPSEEISVQEGVAFATLHRLRQRSRNICRLDKRPAHLQHCIICYANGVH